MRLLLGTVTLADSNKLQDIQRIFAALGHTRFFQDVEYHYENILEKLKVNLSLCLTNSALRHEDV
jgi:hypothetical protein